MKVSRRTGRNSQSAPCASPSFEQAHNTRWRLGSPANVDKVTLAHILNSALEVIGVSTRGYPLPQSSRRSDHAQELRAPARSEPVQRLPTVSASMLASASGSTLPARTLINLSCRQLRFRHGAHLSIGFNSVYTQPLCSSRRVRNPVPRQHPPQ